MEVEEILWSNVQQLSFYSENVQMTFEENVDCYIYAPDKVGFSYSVQV